MKWAVYWLFLITRKVWIKGASHKANGARLKKHLYFPCALSPTPHSYAARRSDRSQHNRWCPLVVDQSRAYILTMKPCFIYAKDKFLTKSLVWLSLSFAHSKVAIYYGLIVKIGFGHNLFRQGLELSIIIIKFEEHNCSGPRMGPSSFSK